MNNYITLNEKILAEITTFISKFTNRLGKIKTHFLADVINGIVSY